MKIIKDIRKRYAGLYYTRSSYIVVNSEADIRIASLIWTSLQASFESYAVQVNMLLRRELDNEI